MPSIFNFYIHIFISYWSVLQEWLGRATNWAKFSATAGLGVIHRGRSGSPYSEGGALYALGLIHANHGEGIKDFLRESLRNATSEVLFQGHIPKSLVCNNPFMRVTAVYISI
jgi:hypothetical protein